jgi:hypothetical protein
MKNEQTPAYSVGWWLMAGAGLFWEKSTAGWLLVADLFWEKSTAGWWLISQANRLEVAPPQELVTNLQLGDAMWGGARSSIGRRKAVRRHQEGGVGSRRRRDRRKGVGPRRCREEDGGGATVTPWNFWISGCY